MSFLTISDSIIWAVLACIVLWLIVKKLILPSIRKSLPDSDGYALPYTWGKLAFFGVFQSVFGVIALAGILLLAAIKLFQLWLNSQEKVEANLNKIISFRNSLESVLDNFQTVSISIWVAALIMIALIWGFVSRSGSRKRWSAAVDARKNAIKTSLQDSTTSELWERLRERENRFKEVEAELATISEANQCLVDECYKIPVFEFQNSEDSLSVNMVKELIVELGENDEPGAEDIVQGLNSKILEFENYFTIDLHSLGGESKSHTLASAKKNIYPSDEETKSFLICTITDEEVKNHKIIEKSINEKEPEQMKEWIGSALKSETTVDLTSKWGKFGGYTAIVTILLSFVGFSALVAGPNLLSTAQALEIGIVSNTAQASNDTTRAVENTSEEDSSDLQARQYISNVFRVSAIRNLTGANARTRSSTSARRLLHQISAADVRRQILSNSVRSVAPSLDAGAAKQAYEVAHTASGVASKDVEKIFDDAFDKRINELRNNKPAWDKIKYAAARSSSSRHASSAFFNTLFIPDEFANSHTLKAYADHAAKSYAKAIVDAPTLTPQTFSNIEINENNSRLTNRDRRIISGYRTEVPSYMDDVISSHNSGRTNPGSLTRSKPPTISPSGAARAASVSQYDNLFPAVAEAFSSAASSGSGGSQGKPSKRPSARSYGKVRFSGRVGGVVIGLEPEAETDEIQIVDFNWAKNGQDKMTIKLETADGNTVDLGSFKTAIIHHALAYAADGRVVTATLPQPVQGEDNDEFFINDRRVVVHPAFEDTAFACYAIEIDRFVDGYMFDNEELTEARSAVTRLGEMIGMVGRLGSDLSSTISMSDIELKDALSSDEEFYETITNFLKRLDLQAEAVESYIKSCNPLSECFPVESYSKQGFDFSGVPEWLECVAVTGREQCKSELSKISGTTNYLVDSGVREKVFTLDSEFRFLNLEQNSNDPLWPLDFIVQAVPQTSGGSDVDVEEGAEPWIFPLNAEKLRKVVAEGISNNANAQNVLNNMKQFVILQRLFRLAMKGTFGADFPLGKLVALVKETKSYTKIAKHEKWNYSRGFNRLLSKESIHFSQQLEKLQDTSDISSACKSKISSVLSDMNDTLASTLSLWDFLGRFENFCKSTTDVYSSLINRRDELRQRELIDEFIYYINQNKVSSKGRYFCESL